MDQPNQNPNHDEVGSSRGVVGVAQTVVASLIARLAAPARVASAVLGLGLAVSAGLVVVLALLHGEVTIALFEIVVVASGIVALVPALKRGQGSPGLTLLCAALAPLVASPLVEPTTFSRFLGAQGVPVVLGSVSLAPVMLAHLAAGLVLALSGCIQIWAVSPMHAARHLIRGAVFGVAFLAVLSVLFGLRGSIASAPTLMRAGIGIAGFLVLVVGVSATGHCLICAFEADPSVARTT